MKPEEFLERSIDRVLAVLPKVMDDEGAHGLPTQTHIYTAMKIVGLVREDVERTVQAPITRATKKLL